MPIETNFLQALDVGIDSEDAAKLDPEYACNWWDETQEPDKDYVLSRATLKKCILKHRECVDADLAQTAAEMAADPVPTAVGPSVSTLEQALTSTDPTPSGSLQFSSECHSLQEEVTRLRQDLQNCGSFSTSLATSFEHSWDVSMRRAAGFHILHQMAILKETETAPIQMATPVGPLMRPSATSSRSKASKAIATRAQAELERLQELPAGSQKWTWGTDLTESDVLSIEHMRYKSRKNSHSDYNSSLSSRGAYPHPQSPTPLHSLNDTPLFSTTESMQRVPSFPSDGEPAPLNIGRFDPLSRYPSPIQTVPTTSTSRLPLEPTLNSPDIAAIAEQWNDDDSSSDRAGRDPVSETASEADSNLEITAIAEGWNDADSESASEADSNQEITAIAEGWNDADSESASEAESTQASGLDPEIAAAISAWTPDHSSSSEDAHNPDGTDMSMQNAESVDEFDDIARQWQTQDDTASASDEDMDPTVDPANLRVSPSKISISNPFGGDYFGFVDETFLTPSEFERDRSQDYDDADDSDGNILADADAVHFGESDVEE